MPGGVPLGGMTPHDARVHEAGSVGRRRAGPARAQSAAEPQRRTRRAGRRLQLLPTGMSAGESGAGRTRRRAVARASRRARAARRCSWARSAHRRAGRGAGRSAPRSGASVRPSSVPAKRRLCRARREQRAGAHDDAAGAASGQDTSAIPLAITERPSYADRDVQARAAPRVRRDSWTTPPPSISANSASGRWSRACRWPRTAGRRARPGAAST